MDAPLEERTRPSFDTPVALRRMGSIALTLSAIAAVTYLVPSFERVRPWVVGEGIPIVRLYTSGRQTAELPEFQGTSAATSGDVPAAPPLPPTASTESPPLRSEHKPAHKPSRGGHGVAISPEEYGDVVVAIENAGALSAFYEALRRSALRQSSAITRVAHYGDSAVAADEITSTARRKLQMRFGDAGHGFMLTAKGNMFYGHRDVMHRESGGWELLSMVRRPLRTGLYGYGGVVATGRQGEYTQFGTAERGSIGRSVSRFEVFYQRYPNGGELRISLDGNAETGVSTRAETSEDAYEVIEVPDGPHSLTLRPRGEVRVYGVSLERDAPGVVYDALGLVGARAVRLLEADPEHISGQIKHRDPHLLVLGFGGNEAGDVSMDMRRYARTLEQVIKLMRAGKPEMSCLLFGPLDQGERNTRGDIVTLRPLPEIVEVQRRVATEQHCAFFDTYKAMGGQNSVGRWYRARPRLFSPDFRHATPAGYALIGEMYYRALMQGFADHLAQR